MARKKERGRPVVRKLPPRIDATAEEIAGAMFALPANHQWDYLQEGGTTYYCRVCGKAVYYPATLYLDGTCADCKTALA